MIFLTKPHCVLGDPTPVAGGILLCIGDQAGEDPSNHRRVGSIAVQTVHILLGFWITVK